MGTKKKLRPLEDTDLDRISGGANGDDAEGLLNSSPLPGGGVEVDWKDNSLGDMDPLSVIPEGPLPDGSWDGGWGVG